MYVTFIHQEHFLVIQAVLLRRHERRHDVRGAQRRKQINKTNVNEVAWTKGAEIYYTRVYRFNGAMYLEKKRAYERNVI